MLHGWRVTWAAVGEALYVLGILSFSTAIVAGWVWLVRDVWWWTGGGGRK